MTTNLVGKKIKSYNFTRQLGSGSFAIVYEAVQDKTNAIVAVKVMQMIELKKSKKLKELVATEVAVLKSCKNINVIGFIEAFETSELFFIVTEFCNGGDLEQHLKKSKKVTENEAIFYLKEILNGFKGLHETNAMHRDFKLANVLLHNKVCKIADLGFAKQMKEKETTQTCLGSSTTMAPEVLERKSYGYEADIWSIGVVFYQLLYGHFPYQGLNDMDLLKNIKNNKVNFTNVNISKESQNFIERCLTIDPTKRISWKQIYEHPLISMNKKLDSLPGKLKSEINVESNKKFYETKELPENMKLAETAPIEVLSDQEIRASPDIEYLKKLADLEQLNSSNSMKFGNLYISKRNDIMFVSKYIEPNFQNFSYIRVNHSIVLFILFKKTCEELVKLKGNMKENKNIFHIQEGFDRYVGSEHYLKVLDQIRGDIKVIEKQCQFYKDQISICPLEIQEELGDFHFTKNEKYDRMMNGLIKDYLQLLAEYIFFVEKDSKIELVSFLYALDYYRNNPRVSALQFEDGLSIVDFQKLEAKLKEKYTLSSKIKK